MEFREEEDFFWREDEDGGAPPRPGGEEWSRAVMRTVDPPSGMKLRFLGG